MESEMYAIAVDELRQAEGQLWEANAHVDELKNALAAANVVINRPLDWAFTDAETTLVSKREWAAAKLALAQVGFTQESLREGGQHAPYIRPAILWFAEQMERKLRAYEAKNRDRPGFTEGWAECPASTLLGLLQGEEGELWAEIHTDPRSPDAIVNECADVANYAMMIADNERNRQ